MLELQSYRHSSINGYRLTGDVARRIGCEKDGYAFQFAFVAHTRDHVIFLNRPLIDIDHRISQAGVEKSGCDRVDANSLSSPAGGEFAGEADEAGFARGVAGVKRTVRR